MDLDDRLTYFVLGLALGVLVGYLARMIKDISDIKRDVQTTIHDIHEIKEEVDEIDANVKHSRNEDGAIRLPSFKAFVLFAVVLMTVYAAFSTGTTNGKLSQAIEDIQAGQKADDDQNRRLEKISQCTLEFTSKTIRALNERTTYTQAQASANVDVLTAQAELLRIVLTLPPVTESQSRAAVQAYAQALDDFNQIAEKSKAKTQAYAYPTNQELAECLDVDLSDVEVGEEKTP